MENPDFPTSLARGRGGTAGDGEGAGSSAEKRECTEVRSLFAVSHYKANLNS